MNSPAARPDDDACYLALHAKDARFDGSFFTGVTSTGIYCRPVCRVRTPRRENCRFFGCAAQAEQAGFRPCLRCRPELAPRQPATAAIPGFPQGPWSIQDAAQLLARQAAWLADSAEAWNGAPPSVRQLAQRLGVSERHLRRIFQAQLGVSPLQYLQTRRLLNAKQLLTDTRLAIHRVALLSGFSSLRRFNAAFVQHYGLNPSTWRRAGPARETAGAEQELTVRLAYRPPYDVAAMLQFFATRQLAGVETVTLSGPLPGLARTLAVPVGDRLQCGWLLARFDSAAHRVELRLSDTLREQLPEVMARVRALLDLDADPLSINGVLHQPFPLGDGLRVPGTLDGFELAVRAVLGQQISVAAARTLANRLVTQFGTPIQTPIAGLDRLFPSAATLADASGDALGRLGIVRQRQRAIQALARAVRDGQLQLHSGADLPATLATLRALPGVGDWTAQYIAMRALRWPDAFPAGDGALHKALGLQADPHPARQALVAARPWQPWRSYAVIRAWASQGAADAAKPVHPGTAPALGRAATFGSPSP